MYFCILLTVLPGFHLFNPTMKKLFLTTFFFAVLSLLYAQDQPLSPTLTGTGVFHGVTPPLRDLPRLTKEEYAFIKSKADKKVLNGKLKNRSYPYAATALPKGDDPVWQSSMGTNKGGSKAPIVNFEGQASPYYPPDCNGTAGPDHYMQTVNCTYAIYSKTGSLLAGPTNMNLLFSGVTGSNYNDGDPLVLYDDLADRWLAVEFSISGSNDYMLVAVSTTNDPTGTWYKYSFDVADLPDYEKFGVWQDGYYMGTNNSSGNDIYVFQRSVMLTGGSSPKMVGFNNAWRPTTIDGFMCVPPVDNDGASAPAGSPGIFITINDDAIGGGTDQLWLYELAVNWTTTTSSTFTRSQQINVPAFNSNFGSDWENIAQPGTSQQVDAIPQVVMNVPQYRNFGSYQTIVCCHTVDVDNTDHAGVRWYELRRTTGTWSIRQSGTYAPDSHSRWMGSIMLNGSNKIALGYSISSASVYPGIRYCGQSAAAYASASGTLDIPEEIIQTGTLSQTSYDRWGDYSLMSVDPSDNETFWFTSQYIGSSNRKTKIASFTFGNSPSVTTLSATNVTGTTATLNGTINPNGLSTNYHFEWGTTTGYGNTTPVADAGSGTSLIPVDATIVGLTGGVVYHFRLIGANSDGTVHGSDVTFSPGAASVTTSAITGVTMTTATSGGNVTTDGGSAVTARGVCWGVSSNPVVTGNHTADGSGTGSFVSNITGLSSNTTYHVRAYATNGAGTFYGEELTFTTLCGDISTFPYNEGFENSGAIPGCWSQEYVTGTLNWGYRSGGQSSHPAAAHGGSFNAFLFEGAYGTDNVTKLVTPAIHLNTMLNPVLKFWHTQAYWDPDQDELRVYYKTSAAGAWALLATYTANITSWTQETISLPNPTSTYFIAFQGTENYGYGVCLDDISITGTAPVLSVSPSHQDLTSGAGATAFTVLSNTTWNAASNSTDWCTVTPSGSGNGTLTANCFQNNTYLARTAEITVSVSGLTPVEATVTQAASIPPSPANLQATVAGNQVQLSWDEPVGGNGLTGYYLYRGTERITPEPIAETSFQDTNLPLGAYEFTATALYGTTESAASSPVFVTIVETTLSLLPDRTGCQNDTLHFPVVVTCVNLDSLALFVHYDPLFISPDPVEPYMATDPRFTVSGFDPEHETGTMALFLKGNDLSGTDLSDEKLIELIFALNAGGNVPLDFNALPEPGPLCAIFAYPGIPVAPVTYFGAQAEITALPDAAGLIAGPDTVVQGSTAVPYSVSEIDGANGYLWEVTEGASIASGNGTASITVDYSATASSGFMRVSGINECGYGSPSPELPVTVTATVPPLRTVANVILATGQSQCYDATDTLTVAGNGTYFIVSEGSSATMIAGQKIIILPDATVVPGGYLNAYITGTENYCGSLAQAMVTSPVGMTDRYFPTPLPSSPVNIYPNPTSGKFIIELVRPDAAFPVVISIYGMKGALVFSGEVPSFTKKEISLEKNPSGIYFLHLVHGTEVTTARIIKL